ncbi:MAG: hypothetical protein HYU63_08930 [Armatimonadetes bacterium]|nr:hypothetical protein [Armatimonadota bacterium]
MNIKPEIISTNLASKEGLRVAQQNLASLTTKKNIQGDSDNDGKNDLVELQEYLASKTPDAQEQLENANTSGVLSSRLSKQKKPLQEKKIKEGKIGKNNIAESEYEQEALIDGEEAEITPIEDIREKLNKSPQTLKSELKKGLSEEVFQASENIVNEQINKDGSPNQSLKNLKKAPPTNEIEKIIPLKTEIMPISDKKNAPLPSLI